MTKIKVVNLLNDFGLGGVTRGLQIFEHQLISEIAHCQTAAVNPDKSIASHYDADIIITHFPPNWRRLIYFAMLRLLNSNARIIHIEHSYSRAWIAAKVAKPNRFELMLRIAFAIPHRIICVSKGQAKWLIASKIVASDRLTTITPANLMMPMCYSSYRAPDSPDQLVIGCYGRFHEAKGFDLLIAAFKKLDANDNIKLIIAGFGPDEALLHTLANDHPDIEFVGPIDNLSSFLNNCHAIIVPSRWEAYGQVATEAKMAGRPIIVANVDGLPEQVGEAGIIADFHDPEAACVVLKSIRKLPLAAMSRSALSESKDYVGARAADWAALLKQEAIGASRRTRSGRYFSAHPSQSKPRLASINS